MHRTQGSGKTLAFLLPLVLQLKAHESGGVRAVVLSPTRELASQTLRVLRRLSPGKRLRGAVLTKAAAAGADFDALDILVATPLRLGRLLEVGRISLARVAWLVMDEADKLFELGFLEQIDAVVAACNSENVRRALFSATLPEAVETLARSVMASPLRLTVGERGAAAARRALRAEQGARQRLAARACFRAACTHRRSACRHVAGQARRRRRCVPAWRHLVRRGASAQRPCRCVVTYSAIWLLQ